jgi:hypothetical protein
MTTTIDNTRVRVRIDSEPIREFVASIVWGKLISELDPLCDLCPRPQEVDLQGSRSYWQRYETAVQRRDELEGTLASLSAADLESLHEVVLPFSAEQLIGDVREELDRLRKDVIGDAKPDDVRKLAIVLQHGHDFLAQIDESGVPA